MKKRPGMANFIKKVSKTQQSRDACSENTFHNLKLYSFNKSIHPSGQIILLWQILKSPFESKLRLESCKYKQFTSNYDSRVKNISTLQVITTLESKISTIYKLSRHAFFDCEKCIPNKTHTLSHPSHTPHHHP